MIWQAWDSFEADTNQIVLSFIKTLGRNPTDLDLRFMIKTLPSANKTQEANLYILQSRMEIDKATKELLDWERRYQYELAEGGREGGECEARVGGQAHAGGRPGDR